MATSTTPTLEVKVTTANRDDEICPPVALKQRFERLLREVFEGHGEYLGLTPDE
jgi:hypothetical protein